MMRFRVRHLLVAVACVAAGCGLFVTARNAYYAERRQAKSALAKVSGISDVKLHTYCDAIEEVKSISFSVEGHPGSIIALGGLGDYAEEGRFSISRVGKWTFRVSGRRHLGAHLATTGEPVESDYLGSDIELGRDSPYQKLIPFELNTLQDLADHYAELVDLFETWPREAEPGVVMLADGTAQFYFVVEAHE